MDVYEIGAWLHVDGEFSLRAYEFMMCLCPRYRGIVWRTGGNQIGSWGQVEVCAGDLERRRSHCGCWLYFDGHMAFLDSAGTCGRVDC